jgi:hypothetical protein
MFVTTTCRISSPKCLKTAKSSYFKNQRFHRRFKDSFEPIGIRTTAFDSDISPGNVVFSYHMDFTDGKHVGHFDCSIVQVSIEVLK